MSDFIEKERRCQESFASAGPYWHGYTSGKETSIIFTNDEDMAFVMNVIAQSAFVHSSQIKIISFQVMNNHFHFILAGNQNDITVFFGYITKRLSRHFPSVRKIKLYLKPISDIQALRNSIVYVNRNGYVANPSFTPFSYPWGTSCNYFQSFPKVRLIKDVRSTEARLIFRGRNPKLPEDWDFSNGYVSPESYCCLDLGMALFRDAHHYFNMIGKSVESYSDIAVDIDDGEYLTDPELFTEMVTILDTMFSGVKIKDLSNAQKLDLARTLHFKYHSSNAQIRRILGISQYDINQLFGPKA